MTGFTQWGFVASHHWLPDAALYNAAWTLRPHGKAYLDLVRKAWWTDAVGRTASDGTYRTRGFLGEYDVTVRAPGRAARTIHVNVPVVGTSVVARV